MGFYSLCRKFCDCCNCLKKRNSLEAKVSTSWSSHAINMEESEVMSYEEVEAHCKDIKNIYGYAIEAMKNFLGKPSYPYITQPKQLYPYILFLCEGLPSDEYIAIKEIVSEKQLLNIQLTVVVKDAKVIHPKVTDFSHIFCKIWISSEDEYLTSVRDISSYLLWDESFILDVSNYESDVFHIEFWSSRPGFFEKLASYSFESFKEDDPLADEKGMYFVGDAVEYVKSLPCVAQNMIWTLKKGPRRIHTKGQVNINVQLGTKKGPDFILHLHCHMALIRMCYEKQVLTIEQRPKLWKNWLEILPNTALTLIHQHALQHGIVPIEQCLCSWLVASSLKMKLEDRISFYLLRDLLSYLLANITEDSSEEMKEVLCKSLSDFSIYSLDMLKDLHKNFDVQNTEMADELYYMLRCMTTAELKLCRNYIQSYEIIEEEASEWYLKIIGNIKKDLEVDDSIEKMGEGLKVIMKIYVKNQIILDDIFSRAWNVQYSSITYKKLDSVICTTIQPMIKHLMLMLEAPGRKRKPSESLKMLQLYHNFRNLVNYIINCIPSQRTVLRMDEYSVWFGEEMVLEWFLLCDIYTNPFIQRAVLADSMEPLSPCIAHGTSVPDVASIIDEMVIEVWMKLKWKDQFYTHGALIEAVKSCVLDYSKHVTERVKMEDYFCSWREFDVSVKLCVALSNVYGMSEHLSKTKERIKKELKIAETALGFPISDSLIDIQSAMQNATAHIFLLVFKKIKKRIEKLIKLSMKTKTENLNLGTGDLCMYIDNTLEIMYSNLKSEAFYIILRHMWILLLKSLRYGLKYSEGCWVRKRRKLNIYVIILQSLNQMKGIFFCDGHGLTHAEMENKLCQELKCDLEAKLHMK